MLVLKNCKLIPELVEGYQGGYGRYSDRGRKN